MAHPAVTLTGDVEPYALRKIRILNGAHTALVAGTRGSGKEFVREALQDPGTLEWLETLARTVAAYLAQKTSRQ